jgi:hypothetical protein
MMNLKGSSHDPITYNTKQVGLVAMLIDLGLEAAHSNFD